jgi:hypothetical protein
MGQYKAMSKMKTTEPSVELKLKKGGRTKKADGGALPMVAPAPMPMPASRRRMMAPPAAMPMSRRAMAARPSMAAPPAMKEGGKADMGQDKAMIKKAFKQHDMQEHKGDKGTSLKLKQGGKMATGGAIQKYATGGVVKGNGGGYKDGGYAKMPGSAHGYKAGGKMMPC